MKNLLSILLLSAAIASAQNAAVSSYLDPAGSGSMDVRIREVRMPSTGLTIGTYWCTLGYWTTGTTSGYGGMQWTSDASAGPRNYIYSQWNDYSTRAYSDPATKVSLFGGEGTGVKSINNDPANQWKPDYWHVTADRCWSVGTHSYFAYITRNGETGIWHHVMTWDTPEADLKFSSAGYCFIEDWTGDGNYRESQLRKGWNRSRTNSAWTPVSTYTYHVNSTDIASGGRSYNKRTNWAGGIKEDATGKFFYMGAGGTTVCTNNSGTNYTIARTETSPQEEYGVAKVQTFTALASGTNLVAKWMNDSTTVPQWSYTLTIKDGATTVLTKSDTIPQKRIDTLDIASLTPASKQYTITLEVTDFFDGKAAAKSATFGSGVVSIGITAPVGGNHITGDSLQISFEGSATGSCAIDLLKGSTFIQSIGTVDVSTGGVAWLIPDALEDGSDYRICITAGAAVDTSIVFGILHPDLSKSFIDRSRLSVYSFDSQQNSTDQATANVLDGDNNTIWHTHWSTDSIPPHEIVLKIDEPTNVSGLIYQPRVDGANGRIGSYEIYLSMDGITWGTAVVSGTFENSGSAQEALFTSTEAQYVKLVALTEASGNAWTSVAELGLYENLSTAMVQKVSAVNRSSDIAIRQSGRHILITGNGFSSIGNVQIVALNGKTMYHMSIDAHSVSIDPSAIGMAPGLYAVTTAAKTTGIIVR